MLDSDVAMLYHYETKNTNKAVKRNIDRFPEEFCFQLTENEFQTLRFQIGTSKQNEVFNQLQLEENIKQRIFFDGQIYDAYSLIIDITAFCRKMSHDFSCKNK